MLVEKLSQRRAEYGVLILKETNGEHVLTSPRITRATKKIADAALVSSIVLYMIVVQLSPAITVKTFFVIRLPGSKQRKRSV